jgi:hypothetical protein
MDDQRWLVLSPTLDSLASSWARPPFFLAFFSLFLGTLPGPGTLPGSAKPF